ncbi:hypothetical protein ACFVXC_18245 [Streptomyces sp. NPDC058257]|uniref:hypothetical protein n=1 Tax=Streptomyces sp. NPDC058257 TaxID=3346409 RepID=UPI0036E92DE6
MHFDHLEDFLLHDLAGNVSSALLTAAAIAVARKVRTAYRQRRTQHNAGCTQGLAGPFIGRTNGARREQRGRRAPRPRGRGR